MISSLPDYLKTAKAIRKATKLTVWYRGIDSGAYSIKPGLYWRGLKREYHLVTDFMTTAPQYLEAASVPQGNELDTLWQWYFMMQHYGLPTRLLDWTENPLVALYFAVFNAVSVPDGDTPCVWALDPTVLNETTIEDEHLIVPGGPFSRFWLPQVGGADLERCDPERSQTFNYSDGKRYSNDLPLAISPPRQNRRIIAQAGVFTIHGTGMHGLEEILPTSEEPAGVGRGLVRIDVDRNVAAELLDDLEHIGITRLALFPELPNVAAHIAAANDVPASSESVSSREPSATARVIPIAEARTKKVRPGRATQPAGTKDVRKKAVKKKVLKKAVRKKAVKKAVRKKVARKKPRRAR